MVKKIKAFSYKVIEVEPKDESERIVMLTIEMFRLFLLFILVFIIGWVFGHG